MASSDERLAALVQEVYAEQPYASMIPEKARPKVKFAYTGEGTTGQYTPEKNLIELTGYYRDAVDSNPEKIKQTIAHELFHGADNLANYYNQPIGKINWKERAARNFSTYHTDKDEAAMRAERQNLIKSAAEAKLPSVGMGEGDTTEEILATIVPAMENYIYRDQPLRDDVAQLRAAVPETVDRLYFGNRTLAVRSHKVLDSPAPELQSPLQRLANKILGN